MSDTFFEDWITRLRMSWMGDAAQRIFGGFGALADKGRRWAQQANVEHLPLKASAASLPLIGADRRMPRGLFESEATYRLRLTQAIPQWTYAARPLGLLMALHYAGFENAILVQQNGRAFQLADAGPVNPEQAITSLGGNPRLNGHPWWTFDADDGWCSRFAILFTASPAFTTWATATFDNSDEATAVWNKPFDDANYETLTGMPVTTGPPVTVGVVASSKTAADILVQASGPFTGTVTLFAYPTGANPFAWLSFGDLARLKSTILTWRGGKQKCMGVYVLVQGKFWGWPVMTFGDWKAAGRKWGGSVVIRFDGA
jgi:hypothetical protein